MLSISVILPIYNDADTLGAALDSVLAQTRTPSEIIVVDDGSADASARVAAEHAAGVTLLRQANAGPAAARNAGVAQARGDAFAFLDGDDHWHPDMLRVLGEVLDAEPTADLAWGQMQEYWRRPETPTQTEFGAPYHGVHLGSVLIRRAAWKRLDGLDESLRRGEDFDFWFRVREQGLAVRVVEHIAIYYRKRVNTRADLIAHGHLLAHLVKQHHMRTRRPPFG